MFFSQQYPPPASLIAQQKAICRSGYYQPVGNRQRIGRRDTTGLEARNHRSGGFGFKKDLAQWKRDEDSIGGLCQHNFIGCSAHIEQRRSKLDGRAVVPRAIGIEAVFSALMSNYQ
jgi:hypothetical protein